MQYLNDDMDELFRKAAKDYPLNTGAADWEKMKQKLQDSAMDEAKKPTKGNNRRQFLWLLLLLPLPWICNRYSGEIGPGDTARNTVSKEVEPSTIQSKDTKADQTTVNTESRDRAPIIFGEPENNNATQHTSNNRVIDENSSPLLATTEYSRKSRLLLPSNENTHQSDLLADSRTTTAKVVPSEPIENIGTDKKQENFNPAIKEPAKPEEAVNNSGTKENEKKADVTDSATTKPSVAKQQKASKQKRFYVGIQGGIDATRVKMQEVKKMGYDVGLLAGYALTDKWSIEAGFMSSEKAYYSKGEYLPKAYLLPNTKLKEANGDCRMWEVPLVARYQFKQGKKGSWFAAAGATSYFMNKEDYNYTYYYPATGQEVERYRSYKEKYTHLFAAAQVSAGYNRAIGKTFGVRVEPYLKLPLKKVGYYDLPLTSYGVHIGVTKKLF